MKIPIYDIENKKKGERELPKQFNEEIREDLIKKAFYSIYSKERQPYGAMERAGMRHSGYVSKRRNRYRSTYGIGQSRTPRKVMSSRGERFNWVGAIVPQAVGGRRAHPPKAEKIWEKEMNRKERRKAIRSAMAGSMDKKLVEKRGHKLTDNYPYIIDTKIEETAKTKGAKGVLEKLGLKEELDRAEIKKVRAGKGKLRNRKYRKKKGPLIVVSEKCALQRSAGNIPGIDVIEVKKLNVKILAPGSEPGRMTFFTEKAVEKLEKDKLFL